MKKRFFAWLFTVVIILGSFGAFAAGGAGSSGSVLDEAGILSGETKEYIEMNIDKLQTSDGRKVQFKTISADKAPENGVIGFGTDDFGAVLVWVDGADEIRMYSAANPSGSVKSYRSLNKEIEKHNENIKDRQLLVKDSFSMLAAGMYYDEGRENEIPDTLKISGESAEQYICDTMSKYKTRNMILGIAVAVVLVSAIIVIFMMGKIPEGKLPGDGSNFKDGYGSGVAATTKMPGQADNVAGSGGIGRGMGGF